MIKTKKQKWYVQNPNKDNKIKSRVNLNSAEKRLPPSFPLLM